MQGEEKRERGSQAKQPLRLSPELRPWVSAPKALSDPPAVILPMCVPRVCSLYSFVFYCGLGPKVLPLEGPEPLSGIFVFDSCCWYLLAWYHGWGRVLLRLFRSCRDSEHMTGCFSEWLRWYRDSLLPERPSHSLPFLHPSHTHTCV